MNGQKNISHYRTVRLYDASLPQIITHPSFRLQSFVMFAQLYSGTATKEKKRRSAMLLARLAAATTTLGVQVPNHSLKQEKF